MAQFRCQVLLLPVLVRSKHSPEALSCRKDPGPVAWASVQWLHVNQRKCVCRGGPHSNFPGAWYRSTDAASLTMKEPEVRGPEDTDIPPTHRGGVGGQSTPPQWVVSLAQKLFL